jgi:hypothetical protein
MGPHRQPCCAAGPAGSAQQPLHVSNLSCGRRTPPSTNSAHHCLNVTLQHNKKLRQCSMAGDTPLALTHASVSMRAQLCGHAVTSEACAHRPQAAASQLAAVQLPGSWTAPAGNAAGGRCACPAAAAHAGASHSGLDGLHRPQHAARAAKGRWVRPVSSLAGIICGLGSAVPPC